MKLPVRPPLRAAGFTLAEVAVTLLIVGMCLMYVLQGINTAKMTSLDTHQKKVAREMATLTLGRLEAGMFWEDLELGDDMLEGNYAEEGYEDYSFELLLGEDREFSVRLDSDKGVWDEPPVSDTTAYREYQERQRAMDEGTDEAEDEAVQPYEDVRIRVYLDTDAEYRVLITLERRLPWTLVYGEEDAATAEEGGA